MYELHMPLIYHELSHHSLKLHLACSICMIKFSGINQASSVYIRITLILRGQCCSKIQFKFIQTLLYIFVFFCYIHGKFKFLKWPYMYFSNKLFPPLCPSYIPDTVYYIELSLKGYRFLLCNSISNSTRCSKNKSDTMIIIALESCG